MSGGPHSAGHSTVLAEPSQDNTSIRVATAGVSKSSSTTYAPSLPEPATLQRRRSGSRSSPAMTAGVDGLGPSPVANPMAASEPQKILYRCRGKSSPRSYTPGAICCPSSETALRQGTDRTSPVKYRSALVGTSTAPFAGYDQRSPAGGNRGSAHARDGWTIHVRAMSKPCSRVNLRTAIACGLARDPADGGAQPCFTVTCWAFDVHNSVLSDPPAGNRPQSAKPTCGGAVASTSKGLWLGPVRVASWRPTIVGVRTRSIPMEG